MSDQNTLKSIILETIGKVRNLGEHAGGSGHLAYRSLIKFESSAPKEILYEGKESIEVICKYDIYTETEFLHPPEDDIYYTEFYREKFILDRDLKILAIDNLNT